MMPTSVWFPFVVISFVFVGRSGRPPAAGSLDQMDAKPIDAARPDWPLYRGDSTTWDGITDRIPEWGGDRITGTNVLFFTMGNNLGLSQGDHNGGVTGLVRWP